MFISKGFLSKRQLSFKRILTLMIVLTICFIFTQSLLPPEIAAKESEVASDIVADILPSDSAAEQYAENHMDKVAHFAECVRTGAKPLTDGYSALQGLRVIWALYDAEHHNTMADLRGMGLDQ